MIYRAVQNKPMFRPTKTYAKYEIYIKFCSIIKPHSTAHCQNCHEAGIVLKDIKN